MRNKSLITLVAELTNGPLKGESEQLYFDLGFKTGHDGELSDILDAMFWRLHGKATDKQKANMAVHMANGQMWRDDPQAVKLLSSLTRTEIDILAKLADEAQDRLEALPSKLGMI
jgi:hypothetical protein